MRIGILTLPFNNNYGGYLQAFALMTVLRNMGHKPTIIFRRQNKTKHSVFFYLKYFIKSVLQHILGHRIHPLIYSHEGSFFYRGKNMLVFVNKYMQPQTKFLYSTDELREDCKNKFDAYIVGSDQVWRPIYVPNIENFFLDFTQGWDVRRIAYAASFGNKCPEYSDEQKVTCAKLLNSFDAISLREKGGLEIFRKFKWSYNNTPSIVLDPTMLLSRDFYLTLVADKLSNSQRDIFTYILDKSEDKIKIIQEVIGKKKCEAFSLCNSNTVILPPIEDWLVAFRDSEFVITDSFHGTVFSIIFNTPFIVCNNEERGADRITSLLDLFNLRDRIVRNNEDINLACEKKIDWLHVNSKLSQLQDSSLSFLSENLRA